MITCLEDQLRRDEGERLKIYQDTMGKWTIGIGRNLSDVGISPNEAALMLANDIKAATVALESQFPWTVGLEPIRKAVLLNMTFNMGIAGLAEFRQFLSKVQAGDYAGASQDMLQSLWAKQVGPRAQRLAIQMESGFWQ